MKRRKNKSLRFRKTKRRWLNLLRIHMKQCDNRLNHCSTWTLEDLNQPLSHSQLLALTTCSIICQHRDRRLLQQLLKMVDCLMCLVLLSQVHNQWQHQLKRRKMKLKLRPQTCWLIISIVFINRLPLIHQQIRSDSLGLHSLKCQEWCLTWWRIRCKQILCRLTLCNLILCSRIQCRQTLCKPIYWEWVLCQPIQCKLPLQYRPLQARIHCLNRVHQHLLQLHSRTLCRTWATYLQILSSSLRLKRTL